MSRSRVAAPSRGNASVWSVIRVGLVVVLGYAVVTATPAQRSAMLEGVSALASAVQDACARAAPCQTAVHMARDTISDIRTSFEPGTGRTSELKGSARPVPLLER